MHSANVVFNSQIDGIPCKVRAYIEFGYEGNPYEPPSSTEVELIIMDRGGYPSPWLEAKIDKHERKRLEQEAIEETQWEDF